jgi:serine/threonine protein kinase
MDLSDYKKVKSLGRGRFGTVRLLENKSNGKQFAVKYIEGGPEFDYNRLMKEVTIHAELTHPCIIKIVGLSLPSRSLCKKVRIVMEYASNGSVEDALIDVKRGDIPEFWTHSNVSCIIVGIVLGMKYLHSKDIIHRDLKPGNLLLDSNFRVRICDFGTAVYSDCSTTITGTPIYMSPESFDDPHPTKKFDVFAFGLILFELLCNESVFPKDSQMLVVYKLHKKGVRPQIPEWISAPISELIESCWSVNPESRPSFDEIYDKLAKVRFRFFDDVHPEVVEEYISKIKFEEKQN